MLLGDLRTTFVQDALAGRGVLTSRKGISGGYALSRPALEIRLSDVLRWVDGPLAALSCASL